MTATRLKDIPAYQGLAVIKDNGRAVFTGEIHVLPQRLSDPLHWRKPCRIFVDSMSDLFHEAIPDEFIDRAFAVMAVCPQHQFQILTKRPQRMADYFASRLYREEIIGIRASDLSGLDRFVHIPGRRYSPVRWPLPLSNVWLGVSVEDQPNADSRIPLLLKTHAAVRFISVEPMLGPISLAGYLSRRLSWVIVGCESGPCRRYFALDWAHLIVAQCRAAGVPLFIKQLPINGKVTTDIHIFPPNLQTQEWPK